LWLDRTALVRAADDGLPQPLVDDRRLPAGGGPLGDAPPEQDGDLVRRGASAVEVQPPFAPAVQRRAAVKAQVGAIVPLADDQALAEALRATFLVREAGHQRRQPAVTAGPDVGGRTPVGPLRQAIGLSAGAEGLATRLAMEPFGTPPTGQPFMAVDAQAGMNREVRADAQDPPAELRVREIEVVLPDEAVAHVDVVAPLREADATARILPALADAGDPLVPAKLPVERFDPLRAAHVFRRRDQVQVVVLGDGVNKVLGVGGKRPDVSGRPVDCRPRVLAKAHDASR